MASLLSFRAECESQVRQCQGKSLVKYSLRAVMGIVLEGINPRRIKNSYKS